MSKKTIIIVAVAVIIALAAGGGVMFMLLGNKEEKPKEILYYSPGEYFVTNIKGSNTGLIKATVTVGYTEKNTAKELEAKNAAVRNTIVFSLRAKTKDELKADNAEELLSNEICTRLNQDLGVEDITKIYFSDLVIQG